MKLAPLAALLLSCSAHAATVGVDIGSIHIPASSELSGINPGVYVRLDNGAAAGVYRNSFGRASAWAGYTVDAGPFSITLGLVGGYQFKRTYGPMKCGQSGDHVVCGKDWQDRGNSRGFLSPLVAPSVRLPAIGGITPRLTVLPPFSAQGHAVFHLSAEFTV